MDGWIEENRGKRGREEKREMKERKEKNQARHREQKVLDKQHWHKQLEEEYWGETWEIHLLGVNNVTFQKSCLPSPPAVHSLHATQPLSATVWYFLKGVMSRIVYNPNHNHRV